MKFSIGYQLPDEYDSTAEIVDDYIDAISNVYFAFPGRASARSAIDPADREEMLEELSYIHKRGPSLSLLYNANCYAEHAVSPSFKEEILKDVGELIEKLDLMGVTTTSPFVARVMTVNFPDKLAAFLRMGVNEV